MPSQEPEPVFWTLGAGAGAAWEKTSSRSRLKKKSGAGAAKKFAGSQALVVTLLMSALYVARNTVYKK